MSSHHSPQASAESMEAAAALPPGNDERFAGYALMGLPFTSGHILAFRRFPASSVGPAYTAVWLLRPDTGWEIYADAPPSQSCARYFGAAVVHTALSPIEAQWANPNTLEVRVPGIIEWIFELRRTSTTAALSTMARHLPAGLWESEGMVRTMGAMMGPALHTGTLRLNGGVPNGQTFLAKPLRVWEVRNSRATVDGLDIGKPAPLSRQQHLADFWLPQKGLFVSDMSLHFPSTRQELSEEQTQRARRLLH